MSNVPGGDRREWRKFKHERIKPAVEEINTKTDLAIELVEHKKGRALAEVQFSVRRKVRQHVVHRIHEPVNAGLVVRAQTRGISESKMDALIREFNEAQVDPSGSVFLEKHFLSCTSGTSSIKPPPLFCLAARPGRCATEIRNKAKEPALLLPRVASPPCAGLQAFSASAATASAIAAINGVRCRAQWCDTLPGAASRPIRFIGFLFRDRATRTQAPAEVFAS